MKTGTRLGPKRVRVVHENGDDVTNSEIIDVPDSTKMAAANAFLISTVAAMGDSDVSRSVLQLRVAMVNNLKMKLLPTVLKWLLKNPLQ